jgi:hypothetical protein
MGSIVSIRNLQRHLFPQRKLTHLFPTFTYETTQYSKVNFNSVYHPEFHHMLVFKKHKPGKQSKTKVPTNEKTATIKTADEKVDDNGAVEEQEEDEQEAPGGYIMEDHMDFDEVCTNLYSHYANSYCHSQYNHHNHQKNLLKNQ